MGVKICPLAFLILGHPFFWFAVYWFCGLRASIFLKSIFPFHFLIRHAVFLSYSGAFDSCLVSYPSNLSLGIRSPQALSSKGSNKEGFAAKTTFAFLTIKKQKVFKMKTF